MFSLSSLLSNPSPAKVKARRKLNTGNPSMQFDEKAEVERPPLYSTIHACSHAPKGNG